MTQWAEEALRIGAALATGLLIGIERGWTQRDNRPGTRVAGVRTFTLLGLTGGLAGLAGAKGQPLVAGSIILATAALLVIAYSKALEAKRDATTAIAALATLAIAFLAGLGSQGLGVAAATVTVLALGHVYIQVATFECGDEVEEAGIVSGQLVVSGSDAAEVFDPFDKLRRALLKKRSMRLRSL